MTRSHRRLVVGWLLLALAAVSPPTLAQRTIIMSDDGEGETIIVGGDGSEGAVDPAAMAANAMPGRPAGSRVDRLRKLVFDRRPSVALKAWSTPFPPPEPKVETPPAPPVVAVEPP